MCIKWDAETTGRRYKCLRNMETKNPDTPYTLSLWSNLIAKEDIRERSKTWRLFWLKLTCKIPRFDLLFYCLVIAFQQYFHSTREEKEKKGEGEGRVKIIYVMLMQTPHYVVSL